MPNPIPEPTLVTHKRLLPSFDLLKEDQLPVCLYTILSINEAVGDCAAYEAVGPTMTNLDDEQQEEALRRMKAGGAKISETDARSMFYEIEDMNLRYRP